MFKPMLAASTVPNLEDIDYPILASPKLDGIRCLIVDGVPYSRNMKIIPNVHIRNILAQYDLNGLDGELMIDGDFNSVQSAVMSEHGEPQFYFNAFDDFNTSLGKPFSERSQLAMMRVARLASPYVRIVPQIQVLTAEHLANQWSYWLSEGYEGAIVRDPAAPYKYGRSTLKQGWMLKLKKFDDSEGFIIACNELMHNCNTAELGELGQTKRSSHKDGKVPGHTLGSFTVDWDDVEFELGTGFDQALRAKIWGNRANMQGLLVKFKYQGVGPNGKPRFPVFLGFRHADDL